MGGGEGGDVGEGGGAGGGEGICGRVSTQYPHSEHSSSAPSLTQNPKLVPVDSE